MNGITTVNYNNNGSLVTDGLSNNPVTGNAAMGLVSDDDETMDTPVTSWIFSIITACGLLIFLFVSFYQYHKRMREKRVREHEYMKQFKELLPDCDYNDFKVTRARSVMTNTHFNTFPNKDGVEFKLGPPLGRRLFRTVPKLPPAFPRKIDHIEVHKWPNGDGGEFDFPYIDDSNSDFQHEIRYVQNDQKVSKINRSKRKQLSEIKGKLKRKKKRKFLSNIGSLQKGDFEQPIENVTYQSPYLSDFYLYTKGSNSEYKENIELQRQTRSESDIYTFRAEDLNNDGCSTYLLNDYYIEAGIPRPASASSKRRQSTVSMVSSSDSRNRNALYDRLALRDGHILENVELVHRDANGVINLNARSLPMLDSEHYEIQLKEIPPRTNMPTSNSSMDTDMKAESITQSRRSSEPLLYSNTTLQNSNEHEVQMEEKF